MELGFNRGSSQIITYIILRLTEVPTKSLCCNSRPSSFSPPWKACHFWDLGWQAGGWGEGGNSVRNTRIPCNLQCFLVAQILAKKPRLRSPLERMRVLQCFCFRKAECAGIRSISWMPDMSLFFDEVVLKQFARKTFLHERQLYLPKRLRNSSV